MIEDLEDEQDWNSDYLDDAIQEQEQKEWLDSCPKICHTCRWFDSYYRLGCTQAVYLVDGKCYLYTHHKWFKRLWIGKKLDLHYLSGRLKSGFAKS